MSWLKQYWLLKLKIWWKYFDIFAHNYYWCFWLGLFVILRLAVIFLPGPEYSDVTHYYERYANIWHYGNPPYTHWVFEYGPLAALTIYLPLRVDLAGIGQYYVDFKILCMLCEGLMWTGLVWYQAKKRQGETWPLLWYLVLTTLAKNWLYEGIDMIFVSFSIGAILALHSEKKWRVWIAWMLLWASTAVKFLTLPLIAPFYLITRKKWWMSLAVMTITFLLIWGGPILYYRSSLSVPFVYNSGRTIKYNTITHLIIRTINDFTHSEEQSEEAPDYSFVGPMSMAAGRFLTVLYPISLLLVLMGEALYIYHAETGKWWDQPGKMWQAIWQTSKLDTNAQAVAMTWCYTAYFLVSFVTAKIFSNPFCLWILPTLILLSWRDEKNRKKYAWWLTAWAILELTPFLTAGFWRLQQFTWFKYEIFEVTYGWIKWMCMIMTSVCVWREMSDTDNL